MFNTLSDRLSGVFTALRGKGRLSDADIDATAREIRIALLEADVALPVVKVFVAAIKERSRGEEVSRALNPAQQVIQIVNEELVAILGGETRRLQLAKNPPTVIMLAGLQGSGKTTLAGKLGRWLASQGHTPLLVAADLQRPNAVTQLQVVGEQAKVDVFAPEPGNGVGDPVDVARRSIEHARRAMHDVVVVDTAGRLGIDAEMMAQAAAIRDAVQPDETLFVVDAMIGQDAVTTAQAFRDGVGISGVVLTKLDGDARGGAALSVRYITGEPILFASTGEKLVDFDVFHPERMASRILGMGDMLTLIEQAQSAFDEDEAERMASKLTAGNDFTLEDFMEQMLAIRKLGPISNLLGMLPGMGQMKDQIENIDDKDLDRTTAIIRSMTPAERHDPKIINGSRRARIAKGSGVAVSDVNSLVDRFFDARKMMQQMAGQMGLPGMRRRPKSTKGKKGKKGRGRGAGPTPPKARGGLPGMPGFPALPPGALDQLPPGAQLPDLSKLNLPKGR
ncbi:MAG TPA: signal recognition particle protein [Mycobacteriales bacterium]|nr:signal recognition particle protein [Mycobacteriales bacterium]